MRDIPPELAVIVTGIVLLSVGLAAWLGWERAMACVGLLLVLWGTLSLAADRADRGR